MKNVLRGNFTPEKPVAVTEEQPSLRTQFEQEALKRLGGSIAFVSRKPLIWTGDTAKKPE